MPPPLHPSVPKGKGKKKKKNVTQKPAFITKPIQVRSQPGPNPQHRGERRPPSGMVLIQPGVPAAQRSQAPSFKVFQAPHPQPETLIDLTDDKAPETPLPVGGWKPLDGANGTPSGGNPPNKGMTRKQRIMKLQEKVQKQLEKKAELAAQMKNKYNWINMNKQHSDEKTSTGSDQQGHKEIKWEVNLVDSDDEKTAGSASNKAETSTVGNPVAQRLHRQVPVQGGSDTKQNVQNQQISTVPAQGQTSKMEDTMPGTSYSTGRYPIAQSGNTVGTQPQPLLRPLQGYAGVKPYKPFSRTMISDPTGIPKSFLTAQHMAALYATVQPPSSPTTAQAAPNWDPNWAPNPPKVPPKMPQEPKETNTPMYVQTNVPHETPQQYSPSEIYDDSLILDQDPEDGTESSGQSAQKRLSAFQRLGPVTQPKKPKLTINILFNKDQEGRNQAVREVVDETDAEEKYVPVHLRPDVTGSADETVARYLPLWPWKRNHAVRKSVTHRTSRSVMILEQEQMEEAYEKDHAFFQVSVRGYPAHWRKENVLDVVLDSVRGKSFIPCFIEFTPQECKFLVIRCRSALTAIHKLGFCVRKDDVELAITIYQIDLSLNQIEFLPRLVLRKRLAMVYDGERKLNLKEFTLKPDVSHFIYFPLNRLTNQTELAQLQSAVVWDYLTDLDLSHNRLTSLDGFDLTKTTPKLKHLDLSYNHIERVTTLLRCRELALRSLKLEGNPLCRDYTDPKHYVRVIRMIFSGLVEIDGIAIHLRGDLPEFKKNYCPEDAESVVERFLEVFFPLLDMPAEDRKRIEDLYDDNAVLTVTYRYTLRHNPSHRFRNLLHRARSLEDGETDAVEGAAAIGKLVGKWPPLQHDPYTLTADVLLHTESHTILRVGGILKLPSESLAEDEHLLAFTRTLVLATRSGAEYRIQNEMLYWDDATRACAYGAFQINSVRAKKLSLKFESTPDKDLQEKIVEIFMKLTNLEKSVSIRCLEIKEWNLKSALEHFVKLLKLNDLDSLKLQQE